MTRNLLDIQIDGTAEHNDMIPVLLGLWKVLDDASMRLEALPASKQGTAGAADRDVVLALLGLLSLRGTLHNWLCQCGGSPPLSFKVPVVEANATELLR